MTKLLLTIVLVFNFCYLQAQNEVAVDSLVALLKSEDANSSKRADLLFELMQLTANPNSAIAYADSLLLIKRDFVGEVKTATAYSVKGVAYRMKGNLRTALHFLFLSVEKAIEADNLKIAAESYLEIGSTYSSNGDLKNALIYENKAIAILRKLGREQELAINLLNTGYTYYSMNQYDMALLYYNEAGPVFDSLGLTIGQAYLLGNRALVYWKTGEVLNAEQDLMRAIEMLKPLGDKYGMADFHNQLGNLYMEKKAFKKAINHLQTGLQIALELDLKEQIRDASLALAQLHETNEQFAQAYAYHQQYVAYKDSIQNKENTNKMADLRTEFEVNLREKEISSLEKDQQLSQTYIVIAIILLLLSVTVLLYFRQRFINTKLIASNERKAHDDQIQNLLRTQETKALQAMVQGKEAERKHLATELHNHLGNQLATIKANLEGLDLPDHDRQSRLLELVSQTCEDVRNISHELNMGVSENFGLLPALKELIDHLQQSKGIQVEFTVSLESGLADSKIEILIYRIIQELISNVLKHAGATKLSISLTEFEDDQIINILVHDNGKGFDVKNLQKRPQGIGLNSLEEMIHQMDGEIGIDSSPKGGTTVSIDLPITNSEMNLEQP